MSKKSRLIIITLFSILLSKNILFPCGVYAIAVSPSRTEITISAGGIYEGEFVVSNPTEGPIKVVIFPDKALMGIEEEEVSKWVKIDTKEVIIPSEESREINYKVVVPKEAKGEYIPTVVFREEPIGRELQVIAQIKMPIYIIIEGTEIFKGQIEAVKVLSAKPIRVSILVRNDGNVHVRPLGVLTIKKITREKKLITEATAAVLDINKRGGPIFGGTVGDIGTKVEESLDAGNYVAELELGFSPGMILRKKISFEVLDGGLIKALEQKE